MAGWIKMPLGVEVGLSPGDFVLDGDPAPALCTHRSSRPASFLLARQRRSVYRRQPRIADFVPGYTVVRESNNSTVKLAPSGE